MIQGGASKVIKFSGTRATSRGARWRKIQDRGLPAIYGWGVLVDGLRGVEGMKYNGYHKIGGSSLQRSRDIRWSIKRRGKKPRAWGVGAGGAGNRPKKDPYYHFQRWQVPKKVDELNGSKRGAQQHPSLNKTEGRIVMFHGDCFIFNGGGGEGELKES